LKGLLLKKRLLYGMQCTVTFETFDRHDLLACSGGQRGEAGPHGFSSEQYGAGSALTFAAAVLGSRQLQLIAQDPQQGLLGRGGHRVLFTVYRKDNGIHTASPNPDVNYRVITGSGHEENEGEGSSQ
jgi:hypothetical protein